MRFAHFSHSDFGTSLFADQCRTYAYLIRYSFLCCCSICNDILQWFIGNHVISFSFHVYESNEWNFNGSALIFAYLYNGVRFFFTCIFNIAFVIHFDSKSIWMFEVLLFVANKQVDRLLLVLPCVYVLFFSNFSLSFSTQSFRCLYCCSPIWW